MNKYLTVLILMLCVGCVQESDVGSKREIVLDGKQKIKEIELKPIGEITKEHSSIVKLKAAFGPRWSSGTGFFLEYKKQSYLITAKHVVIEATEISAYHQSGPKELNLGDHKMAKKDIAAFVINNKVICLKPSNMNLRSKISSNHISIDPDSTAGIDVQLFGYPDGWGFRRVVGKIWHTMDMINYDGEKYNLLISTAPCAGGMSGGPVLDVNGNVVGVIVSSIKIPNAKSVVQRSGIVSIDDVINLIDSMRE